MVNKVKSVYCILSLACCANTAPPWWVIIICGRQRDSVTLKQSLEGKWLLTTSPRGRWFLFSSVSLFLLGHWVLVRTKIKEHTHTKRRVHLALTAGGNKASSLSCSRGSEVYITALSTSCCWCFDKLLSLLPLLCWLWKFCVEVAPTLFLYFISIVEKGSWMLDQFWGCWCSFLKLTVVHFVQYVFCVTD